MLDWLHEGGGFMYAILGVSVLAFGLILERLWALTFTFTWDEKFFGYMTKFVKSKDFFSAERMCVETGHPLARVLVNILKNRDEGQEVAESAANVCMQKLVSQIARRTSLLQMFANVATLLGLLGTIRGLTIAFSSLSASTGADKAELLAAGISTAMSTTAFGLIVAIPCIVAYTLLSNKENQLLDKYESQVDEVLHHLGKHYAQKKIREEKEQKKLRELSEAEVDIGSQVVVRSGA